MKKKAHIILGIDPGTRITGYGIIKLDGGVISPIDFGCIKPPPKYDLQQRYLIIFEGVEELIQKYQPDSLAVETQFMQKNAQSAFKIGMARASATLAASKKGITVHEYAPRKAKLAVVGTGSASKEQVQRMMQKLLGLKEIIKPQDAADALALAFCHAHQIQFEQRIKGKNANV
ncbi:crossover junction endodeoxyribonuclease RuvC [Candidatus Aerophobetes bacterium]|uniref:Crossover junction endodeoxyribonuclease RuvC n=1 Tax=Aerophobetes bacterium TaxID=2030807 RepID=A0A2A4YLB6_UNCAE|nr:MAG: crossover junction endodeoxyribonuclease RuvC [Candidatus Aerophobetes bacterium]